MRKIRTTILSLLSFAVLGVSGGAFALAQKTASAQTLPARETELVAPTSYEQYLSLASPSDAAVTDDYTAIADGNVIYVYDRAENEYFEYAHGEQVTKLQFAADETLYFLDSVMQLHSLDPETLQATRLNFSCNTFAIDGDDLYFTAISGDVAKISRTSLSEPDVYASPLVDKLMSKPAIAVWNGELYYTNAGTYLHKVNVDAPVTSDPIGYFSDQLSSLTVCENVLACATVEGEFFTYALPHIDADTLLFSETDGYSTLCSYGSCVYAIRKDGEKGSVRQYSVTDNAFTDYEICAESRSVNRLNGATEVCLAGDKLYIADDKNDRISVYDTKTQSFETPVPSSVTAEYLAADEETVLAASAELAVVYDGESVCPFGDFSGDIVGAANVYGKYYLITDSNHCYALEKNGTAWTKRETAKPSRYTTHLASDIYGRLYVAYGNDVIRYTEAEFLSEKAEGTKVFSDLPERTTKLLVDYAGALYALQGDLIYRLNANGNESFDLSEPLVYTDETSVASFAFGVEENATYVLYEQSYLVKTSALGLPTVKTIAVNGADKTVFAETSADFTVVQTKPNSVVVSFDIEKLEGAEYFPYLSYERLAEPVTALMLGETEQYALLAIYDGETQAYSTCLIPNSEEYLTRLSTAEYRTDYAQKQTAYLSNAVYLYKFPYLTELLTVSRLERGAQIELLGEIDKLDNPYYQIAYKDENGVTQTGYIPKAYVNLFDGTPPEPTTLAIGETVSDKDSVYRLIYLLLGAGAICILTDFLILRKQNKD